MEGQTSIFEMLYPTYKITKTIRLIEFFAGYGSQALALKYLGVPFEHWKICEWAVKSIQAYKDIHFDKGGWEYACINYDDIPDYDYAEYLFKKGISQNYNEPMTLEQIKRLGKEKQKEIIANIQITNNLVNIQQVKGKDLEIEDTDKYDYILTYSFPCQDLSLAGKGKGMSDTSTRSGMLWEVERILTECYELGTMPQILLMENVPQVHGEGNTEDFNKWQLRLEELGYKNYWQDLIATDYGIPQTRNRCFMISILGDYNYTFPKPIPLKLKLKDMLEDNPKSKYYLSNQQLESLENGLYKASRPSEKLKITSKGLCQTLDTMSGGNRQPLTVDKKYYLSDKMINFFKNNEKKQKEKGNGFRFNVSDGNVIAKTITTRAGSRMDDNFIGNKSLRETLEQNEIDDTCYIDTYNRRINKENSGTITTGVSFRNNTFLAIKNATKKGYLEAEEGDGVDISSRMQYHRGTVQKGKTQTLSTMGGENNGVVILGNYSRSNHEASRIVDQNYSAPTFKENHGTITATQTSDLRIRKLTPKECFRLMGVKDEDFEKCAKNQSDSSLYHLAGDSIVVDVLKFIFKQLI